MVFIININKYLQIPYKKNGRDFSGCDCWGLVKLIYAKEYKIYLPEYFEEYVTIVNARDKLTKAHKWISCSNYEQPCIVLLAEGCDQNSVDHLGFMVDPYRFIHTSKSTKTPCINKISSIFYSSKIKGFYKYVE